jgi:hypothetical protein
MKLGHPIAFGELKDVLNDYVRGGWSVFPRVVIRIIQYLRITDRQQYMELYEITLKGYKVQADHFETEAAEEYAAVAEYLRSCIANTGVS